MTAYYVPQHSEPSPVARMVNRIVGGKYPGEAGINLLLDLGFLQATYGMYDADEYRSAVILEDLDDKQLNTLIEFLLQDFPV